MKDKQRVKKLKCSCGGIAYPDGGYTSIFRCSKCNKVGNEKDFKGVENG